ncbi:hypothetical protein CKN82_04235 [Carnobacterium divergens]|uniref:DUF72 domain-containing protein n=1 Tax=Carnobacterium divergens TaxID=2748 RepID=A0AAW8RAF3_CARDV|nr:DUF72 domain-containing protein [Carnobacterium divergens]ANZ98633.1 hypothetical protein BFC22_00325 [Carnobacterium divergens]MDT1957233.1 DUF72 domain-containing protein [Carnobacterium divergens]MDT1973203.1 DUF72 domain-containing protein [Carnobacterium divergens]MDT1996259.1 DUF72 domain-containing protein [Carnobacterium divergens]TFI66913.1 hypothetical protein CKN76_04690 [Carnobacterium divergens]
MITIGLTGWGDHETLILNKQQKLENYASHFPFVELDTSFYALPASSSIESWLAKTPNTFQFIPKALQTMTKHRDWSDFYPSEKNMFDTYLATFEPMVSANRLKAVLFQFPPYFACTKEHVAYLRNIRIWMKDLPVAIEFRNNTWYSIDYQQQTLQLLKELNFIHTVVDQPQTPTNSVPKVLSVTNSALTLYRLHGRNFDGWLNASGPDWRKKRTLYNYNLAELEGIKQDILTLTEESNEVAVIFNNNSGGHAASNGKSLQKLMNVTFIGLLPQQLDLELF